MTEPRNDDPVRTTHEWAGDDPLAATVVRAVSVALDVPPSELEPLGDAVDPDALEALFSPRPDGTLRDGGSITFAFEGCDVTVRADGGIAVYPPE